MIYCIQNHYCTSTERLFGDYVLLQITYFLDTFRIRKSLWFKCSIRHCYLKKNTLVFTDFLSIFSLWSWEPITNHSSKWFSDPCKGFLIRAFCVLVTWIRGLTLAFLNEKGTLDILFCRYFEPLNHVNNTHQRINSLDSFFYLEFIWSLHLLPRVQHSPNKYSSYNTYKNWNRASAPTTIIYRHSTSLIRQHI